MTQATSLHLFEPLQVGPALLRNRIWMTAHATEFTRDHTFSEAHAAYYGERARNGVAAITMEATATHPTSQPRSGVVLAYDEAVVESYRKVAAAVQPHGTILLAQLWHRGRQTDSIVSRLPVWAPSAIPCSVYREIPHEMTLDEIEELIEGYVTSARHAVQGGLDGVEIHGLAHGYLLGQFLSPATNHRDDIYGGSFENRLRIVLQIIDRVAAVVPDDRVVGIRINGDDGEFDSALRPAEWADIARSIVATGRIDYVSVSQGTYLDRMMIYGATPMPAGYEVSATAQIKKAVGDVPVVVVGRISTPEMAEAILERGDADLIGMARQLIADPQWPIKAREGRSSDIRPCVGANHCVASILRGPLSCVHNPRVGREADLPERPRTVAPRRVAVVGGGPGGMRAALVAAQSGHEVTLFEARDVLGGQVAWLGKVHAYREWLGITDWLESQLRQSTARIELGRKVDSADLRGFDAIVVATGARPRVDGWTALRPQNWRPDAPPVPGTDQWNVYTVADILGREEKMPASVMIVDDLGDRRALAIAEYLLDNGRRVEIVTRLPQIGAGVVDSHDLPRVITRLRTKGAVLTRDSELIEIAEDVATLADVYNGEITRRDSVDAVVLVTGDHAEDRLLRELRDGGAEVIGIGDCLSPRRIFDAIWEGELAALRLNSNSPSAVQVPSTSASR